MTIIETLNDRFGLDSRLRFRLLADDFPVAEVDTEHASASIALQGAHVIEWRPKDQAEPVVWVSKLAKFAPGKSIRGGVPLCWPWFGPHATEKSWPAHGFARTVPWQLTGTRVREDGALVIELALAASEQTRAFWPEAVRASMRIAVGRRLEAELTTVNAGGRDVVIGEALHTYFRIGDIADIRILGLEGCEYEDRVGAPARRRQSGAVTVAGEVDRVYVDTAAACVIEDPRLGRRIRIEKSGSASTVVWSPWAEKAERMGDFGPDGWRGMVCVESANALDNVVTVAAGGSHTLAVSYAAEAL